MATVTYINNDYETLAEAMQQLVEMGYFASVEYDSENTSVVCKDSDDNAVLTIAKSGNNNITVSIIMEDASTTTLNLTSSSGTILPYYFYVCSGGAYLSCTMQTYNYGKFMGLFISKTNNDKIGAVTLANGISSATAASRLTIKSVATDDDTTQTSTNFVFGTPTVRNQTVLCDIPTCSAPMVTSYFPSLRYTLTSQFAYTNNVDTPPINFSQDGKRYLWVGYFAIRDEEETS